MSEARPPGRSASTRRALLVAVWLAPTALCLGLAHWVMAEHHIAVPEPLSGPARSAVVALMRTAMDRPEALPEGPEQIMAEARAGAGGDLAELGRPLPGGGPVIVRLWRRGRPRITARGRGPTVAAAALAAARDLAEQPVLRRLSAERRTAARIQVDIVVGRAPLAQLHSLVTALGAHPGLDGIGATIAHPDRPEDEIILLPDELISENLFGTSQPLHFIPDFKIGLDFPRADQLLAKRAALPAGGYGEARRHYFRVRTDSFAERPAETRDEGPPLRLVRGLPPGPEVSAASLRAGALDGGRYLVAHMAKNGRYIYKRNLYTGRGTRPNRPGPYSIPRHAGTTYFLAELYRFTGEDWLREPIERAFAHLEELIRAGGCAGTTADGAEFACVVDRGKKRTDLGATALTVVALVEYQRATGDTRYAALARTLTEFLLHMQRADGSFAHRYYVEERRKDEEVQLFYYAGESAL
ncbi:MAG: hypothetical protein AAGC55_03920, partial [Myxococcota bacterium]